MTSSDANWSRSGSDPATRWVPPPPRSAASLARFIPREELQGFAAWQPDAFAGDGGFRPLAGRPDAAAAAPRPPAPLAADGVMDLAADTEDTDAAALAASAAAPADLSLDDDPAAAQAQALAQQEQALTQARQAGYQDGYRDGLVALDSFKESYAQQVTAQIGQLLQSFDQELGLLEQRLASRVAEVATELARQVVRSELQARPALVAEVAQQAVAALMASARHITVHVHPDDLPLVQAGCADGLAARGARLVAQADVERGGCLVDADLGQVDARMATRWAQAAGALGTDLAWSAATPDQGGRADGAADTGAPA